VSAEIAGHGTMGMGKMNEILFCRFSLLASEK